MFKKLAGGMSGFVKEYGHFDKGSYCSLHLSTDCFDRVTWFRKIQSADILNASALQDWCIPLFSRKTKIFGKDADISYRVKKQGWKITAETIIVDPQGKFLSRVVNKSNLEYAARIWKTLFTVNPNYVPVDWHLDYFSDYRWDSNLYFNKVNPSPQSQVEYSVPLTFGRLYQLHYLGLSFCSTQREEYAQEIVCEILDFMSINPPYFGMHWSSAEEVGIRAVNIIAALNCIRDWLHAQTFGNDTLREILKYLYSCGEYIVAQRNSEPVDNAGDFIAESALVMLSIFLSSVFDDAPRWRDSAMGTLKNGVLNHVHPDGTNPDDSTSLHWSVVEALCHAVFTYTQHKQQQVTRDTVVQAWGEQFFKRFCSMIDVMFVLIKPSGKIPQIGDNPSQHLMKSNPDVSREGYPVLCTASILCEEPRWLIREFCGHPDAFLTAALLWGKEKADQWAAQEKTALSQIPSRAFKDIGWYCMRYKDSYCLVSAGNMGRSTRFCFGHNDKLSYILSLSGQDVIVDPGTYTYYDAKERNAFRSTAFHSTVILKDEEQNTIGTGTFSMRHRSHCKLLDFGEDEQTLWFEAEHYGYKGIGIIHRRRLELRKAAESLSVKDILIGNISEVKWHNGAIIHPAFDVLRLDIQGEQRIHIAETVFHSEDYGQKVPAKKMETSSLSYTVSVIK